MPSKALLIFGHYEACGGPALLQGEIEFRGTLANLYPGSEGNGYNILPTRPGQFQTGRSPVKAVESKRIDGDLTEVDHLDYDDGA